MIWIVAGIGVGIIIILYLWLKNETIRREVTQYRKQLQGSNSARDELIQSHTLMAHELQRALTMQLPESANPGVRFLIDKLPDVIIEGQSHHSAPLEILKRHERKQAGGMTVAELQTHLQQLNNNLVTLLAKNTLHNYIELCRIVVETSSTKQGERAA